MLLPSKNKSVDGQNVLYHYIQKNLIQGEDRFSKELLAHLLIDLSIWIPVDFYRRLPIILPYVVRDNSCRKKGTGGSDEWGSANSKGYLRDDNTLLKGVVRSFQIRSPNISVYNGKRLGTGFVASHIWGKVNIDGSNMISSRHHMLNSFVPNLVWLPVQISKLTDREGSFAQKLLQTVSYRIYGNIDLPMEIKHLWKALPQSQETDAQIDVAKINFFEVSEEWLTRRIKNLSLEIEQILLVDKNANYGEKIKSSRYLPTLNKLPFEQRNELNQWLNKYRNCLCRNVVGDSLDKERKRTNVLKQAKLLYKDWAETT